MTETNDATARGAAETRRLAPAKYRAHLREMSRLLLEGHAVLNVAGKDLISGAGVLYRKADGKEGVIEDVRAIARRLRGEAERLEKVAVVLEKTEQA